MLKKNYFCKNNTMKKFALPVLAVMAFLQSFAQSHDLPESAFLTDSIIYSRKLTWFTERMQEKEVFKYNLANQIDRYEIYINIIDGYEGADWKKTEKSKYTYNGQGILLKMIREERDRDAEAWNNDLMTVYTFDGYDSIVTHHDWMDSSWRQHGRWTYTWNPETFQKLKFYQAWDTIGGFWKNQFRYDTIYTGSGLFDTIRYLSWTLQDEIDTASVEVFDYTFSPDTIISRYRSSTEFIIKKQYHDSDLNADIKYSEKYIDSTDSFRPMFKRFLYLDANANITRDDYYYWNSSTGEWRLSQRIDYNYNADNLLDEKLVYGPGSIYSIFVKRNFFYDENLMLSRQIVYFYPITDDNYDSYDYYYSLRFVGLPERPDPLPVKIYQNPVQNLLRIDN